MRLIERSYSSKMLRPRPTVHAEPDGSLVIIATSWGAPEHAARVSDEILKYVQAARADVEVTSPFEFLSCLSDEANYLRVATMICNERFYRSDNRAEYTAGTELLVLAQNGAHLSYAQVGSPSLLIQRPGQGLTPVAVEYEVSLQLSSPEEPALAPLPQTLLGIESSVNMRCGDLRVDRHDQIVVYAGSFWPETLWQNRNGKDGRQELNVLTANLAQRNPDAPFWLGLIDLDQE
jgi:hypothetical protein